MLNMLNDARQKRSNYKSFNNQLEARIRKYVAIPIFHCNLIAHFRYFRAQCNEMESLILF